MNRNGTTPDGPDAHGDDQAPVGIEIPENHIPAFVSEVLSDVERDTDWAEVVDRVIAPEAREEWEQLAPAQKVRNVLEIASDYDRRCLKELRSISITDATKDQARPKFQEATRCRKNAEILRDAVASAHQEGRFDDDALVEGLEAANFSTDLIADREEKIDQITDRFGFDFRPYGGKLLHTDEESKGGPRS